MIKGSREGVSTAGLTAGFPLFSLSCYLPFLLLKCLKLFHCVLSQSLQPIFVVLVFGDILYHNYVVFLIAKFK